MVRLPILGPATFCYMVFLLTGRLSSKQWLYLLISVGSKSGMDLDII